MLMQTVQLLDIFDNSTQLNAKSKGVRIIKFTKNWSFPRK